MLLRHAGNPAQDLEVAPGQGFPPFVGSVQVLVSVPVPQVALQELQADQTPSTAQEHIFRSSDAYLAFYNLVQKFWCAPKNGIYPKSKQKCKNSFNPFFFQAQPQQICMTNSGSQKNP